MGCRSPLAIGGGREQSTGLFVPNIINHGHCSQREITNLLPCGVSVLVALLFAGRGYAAAAGCRRNEASPELGAIKLSFLTPTLPGSCRE